MAIPSTYHLHHSLPNRSPTQRPRSLSLSEYQPLSFDRDALESAYQASLGLPSSHASSITGHTTTTGVTRTNTTFGGASTETHDTSLSSFPTDIKMDSFPIPPPPIHDGQGVYAGIGAGHTLTPPQSPIHKAAQLANQSSMLSPVPGSPRPPTPPPRPTAGEPSETSYGHPQAAPWLPPRRPGLQQHPSPPQLIMRRSRSELGNDRTASWGGGYEWVEGDGRGRGQRRALPAVPTNVPAPVPPQWEPDYKPQIPGQLTAPSAQNAYASLGAPPPNLPPRRQQRQRPFSQEISTSAPDLIPSQEGGPSGSHHRDRPDTMVVSDSVSTPGGSSTSAQMPPAPPPGAPDYPPTGESVRAAPLPKRDAEKEVLLRATEKTPIWSTHYLDPSLRQSLIQVPHQVANITNIALSGLASGPKEKYNSTVGAPIDGLARAAKDWAISPDGRFISEHGGQELGIGVINSGGDGWARDKGRKRARVEVVSKSGGIKVDLVELTDDRQIDLRIETKSGDVLVLLPDNFLGPVYVTSPSHKPEFLSIVQPLLKPVTNPYSSLHTTFMVPLSLSQDPRHAQPAEYQAASHAQRYIPAGMREENELVNQFVGGYTSHVRGEHSKVTIRSEKGRVVIGLRESRDEEDARDMGLRVGVMDGGKKGKKKWWRP
ncbi:hypothetical protein IAU60_004471 [Kwoniella sp. DSM 27419]